MAQQAILQVVDAHQFRHSGVPGGPKVGRVRLVLVPGIQQGHEFGGRVAQVQGNQGFRGVIGHGRPRVTQASDQRRLELWDRPAAQGQQGGQAHVRIEIEHGSFRQNLAGQRSVDLREQLDQDQANVPMLGHQKLAQRCDGLWPEPGGGLRRIIEESAAQQFRIRSRIDDVARQSRDGGLDGQPQPCGQHHQVGAFFPTLQCHGLARRPGKSGRPATTPGTMSIPFGCLAETEMTAGRARSRFRSTRRLAAGARALHRSGDCALAGQAFARPRRAITTSRSPSA